MANKVGINISGLQADKKAFESRLGGCRSITRMLTNGINAMERGLDKTRLQNVKTKMDSVLEVQYTLERYYEWAIRVIDECIEKYQSVDSVLEKYADDMYDDKGNILSSQTTYSESDSNSKENEKLYTHNGQDFISIPGFSQYAMVQDLSIGNCTAVAWCMGRSMYTGETCDPYSSTYWDPNRGALYSGYKNIIGSNQFFTMYEELSQGKPSMFYAYNGNSISGWHAVTVVGIRDGADATNLRAEDFLCIDPSDGLTKKISEVGYHNYDGQVYTYA